jgi:hypothetical protein
MTDPDTSTVGNFMEAPYLSLASTASGRGFQDPFQVFLVDIGGL